MASEDSEVLAWCLFWLEQDCRQSVHLSLPVYWSVLPCALRNTGVSNVVALWSLTTIFSGLLLGFVTSVFSSQMIAGNLSCRRKLSFTVRVVYIRRKVLVAVSGKLSSWIISAFFPAQLVSVLNITKHCQGMQHTSYGASSEKATWLSNYFFLFW